jgi:ribosomal protein S18 acetylase RimI-like enzyme
MEGEITIRRATFVDVGLISVLAGVTFYEAYFQQDESANLAAYILESFDIGVVRSEIADPDSTFFLVFVDGKAAAYARMIDDSRVAGVGTGRVVEVKRIYVVERFWRTGIGTLLLRHCIDDATSRGFDALWLGVWEENERANAFYAKFGFEQVGTVTFPYGDVEGTNRVLELKL